MSKNKRYYWLKLNEDFFDDDTISWIEEQDNGKEYCLFYLKLCLKSLKTGGLLIRNVGELLVPYDIKKLAEMTHTDLDTALVAMELFRKIGLVQVLDNGEIYMTQLSELVGSETDKAKAMRAKRARDKLSGNNVTVMLPECYPDKEKEKDIYIIDIEEDIELPSDGGKPPVAAPIPYSKIRDLYHELCPSYPKLRSISDNRKKAIAARWKEYNGNIVVFEKLFTLAEASAFLKGKNGRDWSADFDWLMKSANMAKVLEYKYNDSKPQPVHNEKPEPEVVKFSPEEAAAAKRELDARLAAIRAGRGNNA